MSKEHAMRFPLVGSAMLLSLFLLFKFLSKDLVNAVLTAYFFILGIVALSYVQIFSEYLCRHVYLWANDCIHSLVQGNIASIYKTFSSKRMEWQSHCMAGSIYPLYEPHSLWCSFLFVQLCRSWNKLHLCFQWYPVALFDYIFNAAVIEIKIVVTESRYTNLLCGLNDFELLHHWMFSTLLQTKWHCSMWIWPFFCEIRKTICWHGNTFFVDSISYGYMEAPFSFAK